MSESPSRPPRGKTEKELKDQALPIPLGDYCAKLADAKPIKSADDLKSAAKGSK